ncbi:MAG: hypothetical protein KME13_22955 [Myxacorys californica WJT36-NPBG1]|jgi:hypothetical protein|nr:hypothetical protein [Myxacorys californica WJT36-NPBG1]
MVFHCKKLSVHAAIAFSLVPLNIFALHPTAQAQENEDACAEVIEFVSSEMMRGRNLRIDYNRRDATQTYADASSKRPIIQVLVMSGSAANSIFQSPRFMTTQTKTIVQSCHNVGAVEFALQGSSASITLGLMKDGMVKKFTCSENSSIAWGQVLCGGR